MPKLSASKEELKGQPVHPEGLYSVKLKGFKPKWAKKKDSVNLNPDIVIINHPELNDKKVFFNLNTKAKWLWSDFCHGFGVPLQQGPTPDDFEWPGDFSGSESDPDKWSYTGPLMGQQGQVYLIQVPAVDSNGNERAGEYQNRVKYFVCSLPGCVEKHSDNLK